MLEIPRTRTGPSEPRLLSVREAAAYLGSTVWAIRTLVWEEQIPHIRIGKRLLIDRADLDNFVDQHKILPTSAAPPSGRGNKPSPAR
jgi:excisionase family DNA binding protein